MLFYMLMLFLLLLMYMRCVADGISGAKVVVAVVVWCSFLPKTFIHVVQCFLFFQITQVFFIENYQFSGSTRNY